MATMEVIEQVYHKLTDLSGAMSAETAYLAGFSKDLITERTEITEKNLIKKSLWTL